MSTTIKADIEPGGALSEEDVARGLALSKKIEGHEAGPLQFDEVEMGSLKVLMQHLIREAYTAQQTNVVIAAALYRKNLQIVHHEEADGTFTVDLVAKPEPQPETKH